MLGQLSQAYSGLTSIVGYEGGPARGIEDGGFWSDPVTGYAAAAAILAALRERSQTGRGRRIDVSLVEATVATLFEPLLAAAKGDAWKAFASEDARANAAFVEKWRPTIETVTHARHKGMLKVILGESMEHKRLFEQAAAGRQDLIGRSLEINDHSGDVMASRWTGD